MGLFGIRSRDHLWQVWLVGLAALLVAIVGVMMVRANDGRAQTGTAGQLTASDEGLATPLVAGPSAESDRDPGGEQRSVAVITDPSDDRSTRPTPVAAKATTTTAEPTTTSSVITTTSTTSTTTAESVTTETTVKATTSTETVTPTTPETTEPSSTTEPSVSTTVPPTTDPTVTLPTITIPLPPPPQHSITPEDLQAARDRFASMGYTSYGMTVERSCFCLPEYLGPFEVLVRDGEVVSVTNVGGFDGQPVPTNQRILTVPGLFDYIDDGFDSDRMIVVFDKQTGVPRSISIDHIFGAVDDEITVTVSSFSPHR